MDAAAQSNWCHRLYLTKAGALVLYGRALGLSHGEAEDVLQDTFIALLALESAPENPEHYCLRSYRNRALNHRRSLWRRLTRELESRRWFEREQDENPAEQQALHCLKELPKDQLEVIILKIWHSQTFDQIGGLLGISPNTAAGRYRYGIQKLKRCLKGELHDEHRTHRDTLAKLETPATLGPA
jgi:RNA polymerase sigma-70 factor (ECF subfamily)